MNEDLTLSCLALCSFDGVGPALFTRLVEHFGSPKAALEAKSESLDQIQLPEKIRSQILAGPNWKKIESEFFANQKRGVYTLTCLDSDYPPQLLQTSAFPPVLYALGDVKKLKSISWLGVVGSRLVTDYGRAVCKQLIPALVEAGLGIASGFAAGVDMISHLACIQADGVTVGVLGGGLGVIYPKSNVQYVKSLLKDGLLISEQPYHTEPRPEFFPRRNRIISGLSRGILVIEAARKSGALITAKYALEQNRDIFAVPGSIFSTKSEGCNDLIAQGAKLVTSANDLLVEWGMASSSCDLIAGSKEKPSTDLSFDSEEERRVYHLLSETERHPDFLSEALSLPSHKVMVMLTKLELQGKIESLPGQRYRSVA